MKRLTTDAPTRLFHLCICVLLLTPFVATPQVRAATPSFTVKPNGIGAKSETAIVVSGPGYNSDGTLKPETTITLQDIQTALNQQPNGAGLITETTDSTGQHIWDLGRSLLVQKGLNLDISGGAAGDAKGVRVDWLRLRSNSSTLLAASNSYNYNSFASLRTKDSFLTINTTKITSWDTQAQTYDTNIADGRAYVVAKGQSNMSITNSDMSYLGSADGESYGVAWRDIDADTTGALNTRATGIITGSMFSHNYYGLYTFQAAHMRFINNKMFSNIEYGFDPHDYTKDVWVEGNEAYDNGSHGYIISRGCTGFTFLRNSSHDNKVRAGSKNPSAHGFMLDPGADPKTAGVPQAPSTNNTYQDNTAYNNDGYGFRILQSNYNTISNNTLTNNRAGISLEGGSTGNTIDKNTISGSTGIVTKGVTSQGYGMQIVTGADANTVTNNTITNNVVVGINVKTGKNIIQGNTITGNQNIGIAIAKDTGGADENEPPADGTITTTTTLTSPNANQLIGNTIRGNAKGITLNSASATRIENNTLEQNGVASGGAGLSITSNTTTTLALKNSIDANGGYGIEIYGPTSTQTNTFSQNSITNNINNAISVRNGTNGGITPPIAIATGAGSVSGTSVPFARIEVFSDSDNEAAFYEGSVTADSAGTFTYTPNSTPKNTYLTFSATDSAGNTSALSGKVLLVGTAPTPSTTPSPTDPTATPTTPTPTTPTPTTPTPTPDGPNQPGSQRFTVYLPIVIR